MRTSFSLSAVFFTHTAHLPSGEMRNWLAFSVNTKSSAFHGDFLAVSAGFVSSAAIAGAATAINATSRAAANSRARSRSRNNSRVIVPSGFAQCGADPITSTRAAKGATDAGASGNDSGLNWNCTQETGGTKHELYFSGETGACVDKRHDSIVPRVGPQQQ